MTIKSILRFLTLFLPLLLSKTSALKADVTQAPDTAYIGSYVISLHDINFHDKEYTVRFWMWMKYRNPDINFDNTVEVPNAKSLEKPDIIVDTLDDGRIWVLMKMKAVMKQAWKVQDFPFDKQELKVRVENAQYDTRYLVFKADTAGGHHDPDLTVDGWNVTSLDIVTSNTNYKTAFGDESLPEQTSDYASFNILLTLERDAWGLFMKLFVGMYVSFFIACISFYIRPEHLDPRFGLPVGGLFAAVGNKYIIDSLLPETSNFTLVDTLHAVTFICIFLTILVSSISLLYFNRDNYEKARKIDLWGGVTVVGFFVTVNLVMISMAIFD